MKKLLLVFYFAFYIFNSAFSQTAPGIEWQKSFGGTQFDWAYSIIQAADGGYVVAGLTISNDGDVNGIHGTLSPDYWLIKLDSMGTFQFQRCFGGTDTDEAYSIIRTFDGGYIVTGLAVSLNGDVINSHGGGDAWILKLDTSFNIQWQKSLGGSLVDFANCIVQTSDSGYAIAALSESEDGDVTSNQGIWDYWILKTDASGNIQHQKSFGGTCIDWASSISQTVDGGYIVGGWTCSTDGVVIGMNGNSDYWILKLDSALNLQWQKCLGGTGTEESFSFSIIQTADEGFVIAGSAFSNDIDVTGNHGASDYWIVKLNGTGSIIWQKCLGGTSVEQPWSITQTMDGGFAVAGQSGSIDGDVTGNHNSEDYWVVKLDSLGILQWQRCLGGTGYERANSIIQTTDNGYALAGLSNSNDGDVSGNHGSDDFWIVKLFPDPTGIPENNFSANSFNLFPNPSAGNVQITFNSTENKKYTCEIINVLGKNVFQSEINNPQSAIKLDFSFLAKGIYLVKISDGTNAASKLLAIQ